MTLQPETQRALANHLVTLTAQLLRIGRDAGGSAETRLALDLAAPRDSNVDGSIRLEVVMERYDSDSAKCVIYDLDASGAVLEEHDVTEAVTTIVNEADELNRRLQEHIRQQLAEAAAPHPPGDEPHAPAQLAEVPLRGPVLDTSRGGLV